MQMVSFSRFYENDNFKFQSLSVSQSDRAQNEQGSRSFSSESQMTYSGQNYFKYSFQNKILRVSQNEELDLTFRFAEDGASGLIWYAEKGLERNFIYLKVRL